MNYMVPVWSNVQPLKTTAVGGLLTPDLPSRLDGLLHQLPLLTSCDYTAARCGTAELDSCLVASVAVKKLSAWRQHCPVHNPSMASR